MIIAIAGLTGSGKNTLGEVLAERTGFKLVSPTFKDLAAKEGISLMEFQKKAEKDQNIDKKFDALLKEEATGDCIVTTWLGAWILDADLRIYVSAPLEVRAERTGKRDGMKLSEAMKHVKERDEENRMRYLKVYGIDIYDISKFDLKLDSGKNRPEELADKVMALIKRKKQK
ncbi:MAG: cytidylate kinase family protein [Candidatus Micrarchaeia archaeon]|jgi:cytidylate kinase